MGGPATQVGGLLLCFTLWFAWYNCRWYSGVASRNDHLKPNRYADSAIFGSYTDQTAIQRGGGGGGGGASVYWDAYLERQADRGCCSKNRCGRRVQGSFLGHFVPVCCL